MGIASWAKNDDMTGSEDTLMVSGPAGNHHAIEPEYLRASPASSSDYVEFP